jgi:hypothetical protein
MPLNKTQIPKFLWRGGGSDKLKTKQKMKEKTCMESNINNKLKFWRELEPSATVTRFMSVSNRVIQQNGANSN